MFNTCFKLRYCPITFNNLTTIVKKNLENNDFKQV